MFQQSPKLAGEDRCFGPEGEGTLHWPCLLHHGPSGAATPQQASPKPLDSQGPPALSQNVPPPVMHVEVCQVVTPGVVALFEVPANQQADGWWSCVRCGECEPSII
jgi:hypothetical protein